MGTLCRKCKAVCEERGSFADDICITDCPRYTDVAPPVDDREVLERLNFIEAAMYDCKKGKLSPFAALVAIGTIACPGKIGKEEKEWAINALKQITQ